MNAIQIEYFLALARNLSFSETARQIHVSQPAISKQISALESEIGVPLFERGYRSLKLTRAGELFQAFFQKAQTEYTVLREEVLQRYSNQQNRLCIGCIQGIGVQSFPTAVRNFKEAYPGLKFQVIHEHLQGLLEHFEQGEIDILIALRCEVRKRPNFIWRTVDVTYPLLAVSRESPIAGEDALTADLLKNETFLALDHDCTPLSERIVYEFCQALGFVPREITLLPSNEAVCFSVESNMGVALLSPSMAAYQGETRLRCYETGLCHPVVAAWRRNTQNRYVEVFIQELLRHVDHYDIDSVIDA